MKKAFTLAEVLITLGIIGIIAAMTLPFLIGRYNEKVTLHKLETAYSLLSSAYSSLIFEYGTPDVWPDRSYNGMGVTNMFAKRLKLYNICLTTDRNCDLFKGKLVYKTLNGGDAGSYKSLIGTGTKLNDMTVTFLMRSADCRGWAMYKWESVTKKSPYYHACGTIHVDINGKAQPNRYGVDLFEFIFTDTRIVPSGTPPTPYYSLNSSCNGKRSSSWDGSTNGKFCAAWLLIKKNMDYLRKEVHW